MKKLFTERHGATKPRVAEELNEAARNGLLTLVSARIDEEWFGLSFPAGCADGYAYAGTDLNKDSAEKVFLQKLGKNFSLTDAV